MTEFEKKIEFLGKSWHDWPNGQRGVGSIRLRMSLIGPKGAITLMISTGWHLPETYEAWEANFIPPRHESKAMGCAVVIHVAEPLEDYMKDSGQECDVLPGGYCYGDIGFSAADEMFNKLIREGEEAVWTELERWYDESIVNREVEAA